MTTGTLKPQTGRPKQGYHLKDGTRVPGTTTVIGRWKDSGGLLHWAFEQGRSGKERLYDDMERAADIGTYAHEMVRAWTLKQDKPTTTLPPDSAVQAETAFRAFLDWEAQTRLEILSTEVPLVSEQYRFGGTLDAIGLVGGKRCLIDYKTSNGVYPDYLIQLAAYRHLWEAAYPDQPLDGFHLLRFEKAHGDFHHHHFGNLDGAWRSFVLMRELYDLDKDLKKRAG